MEALASRVGRLEAQHEISRRDVSALQTAIAALATGGAGDSVAVVRRLASSTSGPSGAPDAVPAAGSDAQSAVISEWVRLFERELEALRRRTEGRDGPIADLEARMRRLESFRYESGADKSVIELAELVLGGLSDLHEQVQAVGALPPDDGGRSASPGRVQRVALSRPETSGPPLAVGLFSKEAQNRLEDLENSIHGFEDRIKQLESITEGEGLEKRMDIVEEEIQKMESLRRYGVSLRTVEEVGGKVEELQKALEAVPFDSIMRSVNGGGGGSGNSIKSVADQTSGKLSAFDAYRVQAGLEQVMVAMEALTRQRNDDVRLMNEQLTQVYAHVERELPRDGITGSQNIGNLRGEVAELKTRVEAVASVQLQEMERRIMHEARVASEDAAAAREALTNFEEVMRKSVDRSAHFDAKLSSFLEQSDQRAQVESRREAAAAELRREMAKLRIEVSELAAGVRGPKGGMDAETRISMMKSELEVQMQVMGRDAGHRADMLEREIQAIKRKKTGFGDGGDDGSGGPIREDLDHLNRELANARSEAARADVEQRERIARAERELRAEVRATQRLVLEIADGMRGSTRSGAAAVVAGEAGIPSQLALPPDDTHGGRGVSPVPGGTEHDVGSITAVAEDTVEWHVPHVRARARTGDARALISRTFAVPRYPTVLGLRLKLFPLGSRRQSQAGHCSLYVSGPKGAHLQFRLRLGAVEHGPLECFFDRAEKDTGRHDFCVLDDFCEDDGSALVRLIVMRATPGEG